MDEIIERMRDLRSEIDESILRKNVILKKLQEHRSTIESGELAKLKEEARSINEVIKKNQAEIIGLQKRNTNNFEGDKMINILHYSEAMTRAEVFTTEEYRSGFFKRLQGKDLNGEELRAITSAANSGGVAIPTQTMDSIIGQLGENSTLLSSVTVLNIPELISIPKENATSDASWIAEDADGAVGDDSLTNVSLAAYKLIRLVKITANLKAMAISSFEGWIVNTMVKKMRSALEKAIIDGTGTNQPEGLNKTVWNAENSVTTVASGVTYDNLVDLESLVEDDYANNSHFGLNRKTLAQVRKLKDSAGKPIFERAIEDGFCGTLLGYPVKRSRHIADGEIFFGDWASAYIINFSKPIEISSSQEAGFASGSTVYRGLALVDGKPTKAKGAMVKIKKSIS